MNRGELGQFTGGKDTRPPAPTLEDMNISKYNSSKWQLMSWMPEDVLEGELADCIEFSKEPTTEYFATKGKQYKPRRTPTSNSTSDFKIEVIHGDMLEVLPGMADHNIDLVVADPPYNVTEWEWDKVGNKSEFMTLTDSWQQAILPLLADEYNLFWFCSPQFMSVIEPILAHYHKVQSRIVWHRRNMAMGSDSSYKFIDTWEMIFHCGNKAMNWNDKWDDSRFDVQTFAVPQTNFTDTKYHPTQKPIALIETLVKYGSWPGDTVLDPFAGSGTTGAACQSIGRDCVLIEREEEYIDVINQRLFE